MANNYGLAAASGGMTGLARGFSTGFLTARREKMTERQMEKDAQLKRDLIDYREAREAKATKQAGYDKLNTTLGMTDTVLNSQVMDKLMAGKGGMTSSRIKLLNTHVNKMSNYEKATYLTGVSLGSDETAYADYSNIMKNRPTLSAIGQEDTPTANQRNIFKFTAADYVKPTKKTPTEIATDNRRESYVNLTRSDSELIALGGTGLSEALSTTIDGELKQGDIAPAYTDTTTGVPIRVNKPAEIIKRGLKNGTIGIDPTSGNFDYAYNIKNREAFAALNQPTAYEGLTLGTEKITEQKQYKEEQKAFKETERAATVVAQGVEKSGAIQATSAAQRGLERLEGAPPEVQKEITDFLADADGVIADALNAVRRSTSPNKEAALLILQDIQEVHNTKILQTGGKAVSAQEAARLRRALGQAGATGSINSLVKGMNNILLAGQDEIAANLEGVPEEVKNQYFATAPVAAQLMESHSVYGTEEGKQKAEAVKLAKQVAQENPEATPEEINEYVKSVTRFDLGSVLP